MNGLCSPTFDHLPVDMAWSLCAFGDGHRRERERVIRVEVGRCLKAYHDLDAGVVERVCGLTNFAAPPMDTGGYGRGVAASVHIREYGRCPL